MNDAFECLQARSCQQFRRDTDEHHCKGHSSRNHNAFECVRWRVLSARSCQLSKRNADEHHCMNSPGRSMEMQRNTYKIIILTFHCKLHEEVNKQTITTQHDTVTMHRPPVNPNFNHIEPNSRIRLS